MKASISLLTILFMSSAALAAGVEGGNGGGGVNDKGVYKTFYSAGLYVEPQEGSAPTQVPGLDEVMSYISSLSGISDHSKAPILEALVPSTTRTYYIATPSQLTPAVKRGLLAEFSRVTGVQTSKIVLYALTDTKSKTTFILPEFLKLTNRNDQLAILYHEAYWIVHPDASYDTVVKAEMAFEAALDNPSDPAKVFDFTQSFGTVAESFQAKVKWDLSSGSLQGLVRSGPNGNYLSLADLVGEKYMQCQSGRMVGDVWNGGNSNDQSCFPYLQMNIRSLIEKHPNSAVLQAFARWSGDAENSYVLIPLSWQLNNMDGSTLEKISDQAALRDKSRKNTKITWDLAGSCQFLLAGNLDRSACAKEVWSAGSNFTGYGCGNVVCSVPRSSKSEQIKMHAELFVDQY